MNRRAFLQTLAGAGAAITLQQFAASAHVLESQIPLIGQSEIQIGDLLRVLTYAGSWELAIERPDYSGGRRPPRLLRIPAFELKYFLYDLRRAPFRMIYEDESRRITAEPRDSDMLRATPTTRLPGFYVTEVGDALRTGRGVIKKGS